jgi:hypothetical protein
MLLKEEIAFSVEESRYLTNSICLPKKNIYAQKEEPGIITGFDFTSESFLIFAPLSEKLKWPSFTLLGKCNYTRYCVGTEGSVICIVS